MQKNICRQVFWNENMEQMAAAKRYETGKGRKARQGNQIVAHDATQQPDHCCPRHNGKGDQPENEITLYQAAAIIPALLLRQTPPRRQDQGLQIQLFVQRQRRHKSCNQRPKNPLATAMGGIEGGCTQHDYSKDGREYIGGADGPACDIWVANSELPAFRDAGGKVCIGKGHYGFILGLFWMSLAHIAATSWYVQSFLWQDHHGRQEAV